MSLYESHWNCCFYQRRIWFSDREVSNNGSLLDINVDALYREKVRSLLKGTVASMRFRSSA